MIIIHFMLLKVYFHHGNKQSPRTLNNLIGSPSAHTLKRLPMVRPHFPHVFIIFFSFFFFFSFFLPSLTLVNWKMRKEKSRCSLNALGWFHIKTALKAYRLTTNVYQQLPFVLLGRLFQGMLMRC